MFIPIIPHTTVINKTIVYSDTVLSLSDLGSNLQVTSIDNINSYELENCLKVIFEANPNTTFNTIQYSRKDKKIYFYTDKTISTKKWHESKIKKYKPLTSVEEIIAELEHILTFEEKTETDTLIPVNYDDAISLYDIAHLLKRRNETLERDKKTYDDYFDRSIHEKFSSSSSFIVYGFDYDTLELRIGFKRWDDYEEIKFKKENNDFFVSESESYYANEILALLGNTLSNLYDKLLAHKDFKLERTNKIKPVNSNILVNISSYGVSVYIPSTINRFNNDFELECFSYTEDYKYDCNSHTIISLIKDKEDEFLHKILIDIDDCPMWMQEPLRNMRAHQLKKKEPIIVEPKKVDKPLSLGKRLLNWLNK